MPNSAVEWIKVAQNAGYFFLLALVLYWLKDLARHGLSEMIKLTKEALTLGKEMLSSLKDSVGVLRELVTVLKQIRDGTVGESSSSQRPPPSKKG